MSTDRSFKAFPVVAMRLCRWGFCSSSSRSVTPGTGPYRTVETNPTLAYMGDNGERWEKPSEEHCRTQAPSR
eukprot:363561-Chlamydomonas_euryale.AAC.7